MRIVEQKMTKALLEGGDKTVSNDTVKDFGHMRQWFYHGNLIATYYPSDGSLVLEDAGWQTVTTKSRLNAAAYGMGWHRFHVWQDDFTWYWNINGESRQSWDGWVKLYQSDK